MRYVPMAMVFLALCMASVAFGQGANPDFTLPMTGIWPATFTETCATPSAIDCTGNPGDPTRPIVNLPAGAAGPGALYLFVANHNELKGVQTAFDFGGWSLIFGNWTCQPGQLSLATPLNPGGPVSGLLNTAFNCVLDTGLQTIGFMTMTLTGSGCITQAQPNNSTFQALDCALVLNEFTVPPNENQARLGAVCIGTGGVDACDIVSPVEQATWGGIKAQYK